MEAEKAAMDKVAREQIEYCRENPEGWIKALITSNPRRELIHMVYIDFVIRKMITPLQAQTDQVKRYYWELAKYEAKGRLTTEPLKKLAKCLYFIESQL